MGLLGPHQPRHCAPPPTASSGSTTTRSRSSIRFSARSPPNARATRRAPRGWCSRPSATSTAGGPCRIAGSWRPWKRIVIEAAFGQHTEELFRGFIREIVADYPNESGASTVTVECQDASLALDREHVRRAWGVDAPTTDGEIVTTIAGRHSLTFATKPGPGLANLTLYQNSTDIRLLRARAEANGYELYFRAGEIYFGPMQLDARPQTHHHGLCRARHQLPVPIGDAATATSRTRWHSTWRHRRGHRDHAQGDRARSGLARHRAGRRRRRRPQGLHVAPVSRGLVRRGRADRARPGESQRVRAARPRRRRTRRHAVRSRAACRACRLRSMAPATGSAVCTTSTGSVTGSTSTATASRSVCSATPMATTSTQAPAWAAWQESCDVGQRRSDHRSGPPGPGQVLRQVPRPRREQQGSRSARPPASCASRRCWAPR